MMCKRECMVSDYFSADHFFAKENVLHLETVKEWRTPYERKDHSTAGIC